MPWTRSAIEQVLENHGVCVCGQHNYVVLKKRSDLSHYEGLLDDLLACVPQPSREALEKILLQHQLPGTKFCESLGGEGFHRHSILCNDLMAWASGQETRRWCEHLRQNKFVENPRYLWLSNKVDPEEITKWIVCPICAKERPSE